ncbi:hypothetical protein AKJ36_00005 [candidate division MSBL1 archaeon SCGC-AAA259I07]|uniref:Uncharacterized protein n=1 Tax=candidate division MSBL1 archaeon SCGC-AAA259I07 TaxID=1698266 RepID=A0A133UMV4_9EURY|nr:hypothetical protein AKJ36_00005 [candidate division MSBL1 archaeon SCGC-AAA259I07]
MKAFPFGYYLGIVILLLSLALPIYFFCKNLLYRKEERISTETAHQTKPHQLVKEISRELNMQKPRLIFLKSNKLILSSNSEGIVRSSHYIKLTKETLKKLERKELKAALYHEFYHLKRNTRVKNLLNLLSRGTLFGRGTLTALMGFTSEEYSADEFAAKRTDAKSVRRFLSKLEEERLVSEDIEQEEQKGPQEVSIFRKLLDSFVGWKEQFYKGEEKEMEEMLFGKELPTYMSPSYRERIENLKRFKLSRTQSSSTT